MLKEIIDHALGQRDLAPIDYCPPRAKCWGAGRGFQARLRRRGVDCGTVRQAMPAGPRRWHAGRRSYYRELWRRPHPVLLEGLLSGALGRFRADIRRSLTFLNRVRASGSAVEWLQREPYARRLRGRFEITCTVADATDARELQKIYLKAVDGGRTRARDLFIKVNYLSLDQDDASLRLRFSFGEEHFADWRAWARQRNRSAWSARLAQAIFPESRLVVENARLHATLKKIIGHAVAFPERIIYSNAPNGGAFFHHDFVPAHVGVIFAQLHGVTGWLVCAKDKLADALRCFLQAEFRPSWHAQFPGRRARAYLSGLAGDARLLAEELESDVEGPLHQLIDTNADFIGYLIRQGAMRILRPGDVILLPAPTRGTATWHSVFCLDDAPGLSLSFAMQPAQDKQDSEQDRQDFL